MFGSMLAALVRADVAFLVVGGLAVAQAGFARFTEDVDVLVSAERDNLRRMIDVLATFGAGAAADLSPDDFPVEEGAVRIVEDVVIDVFTQMSGDTYADLLPLSVAHPYEGVSIRYLGAEGLIRLKAPSLRPKDQIDVQALRAILDGRDPDA